MSSQPDHFRFMISGGGTGGHIFPALAIGKALKHRFPNCEVEFVGAKGRMEMEKIPEEGFQIHGLWISGIQRKLTFQNAMFPFKVISSLLKSFSLLKKFKPHVVIGVGGYASGPLLYAASLMRIPTVIQEQNSYPGITNKLLGKRVNKILTAFDGPEKHFPPGKIKKTGNPVRKDILNIKDLKPEALTFFNLNAEMPVVLVVGGSLGARTINTVLENSLDKLAEEKVQLIWQTGKSYTGNAEPIFGLRVPFIKRMDLAYAAADLVISRAGALSISELCIAGKPCILVPSPNVAEDHQTNNAMTLVNAAAAILIKDSEAKELLLKTTLSLIQDPELMKKLSAEILKLAKPNATENIIDEIVALIEKRD